MNILFEYNTDSEENSVIGVHVIYRKRIILLCSHDSM